MGFFKSFFSGKTSNPEEEKQKNKQKNFEIFKYDGMRAQRMGRADYAIKCFTEALALQEDFETMLFGASIYPVQRTGRSPQTFGEDDPNRTGAYLHLPHPCQRLLHARGLRRHGGSRPKSHRH